MTRNASSFSRCLLAISLAAVLVAASAAGVHACVAADPGVNGPPRCWQGSKKGPRKGGCNRGVGSPVDEINTFTGNLTIEDIPVYYEGLPGAVPFAIRFNSQSVRTGPLGDRWTHSWNTYLVDNAPYWVEVIEGNGQESYFTGAGPYTAPPGVFDVLEKTYSGSTWTGWRLTRDSNEQLVFNTAGKMTSYRNADGLTWTLTYSSGLLIRITDPLGRRTTLTYSSGYLTRVTVPGGAYASFQYDTYTPKRLVNITDAVGDSYALGYSGTRVINITDPTGSEAWYAYGTANGRVAVTSSGIANVTGSTVTYAYLPQANGQLYVNITEQKDGASRLTRHIYENTNDPANGRHYGTLLATTVDPSGIAVATAYGYDSHRRVVGMRDSFQPETGGKAHRHFYYYSYSPPDRRAGLVTKYIDPENSDANPSETGTPTANCPSYRYQYDTRGNLTKITTPENRVTDFTYFSGTDRLASMIIRDQDLNGSPVNRTTSFTYWGSTDPISKRFQLKTVTDARGNTTSYDYNANGYLSTITPPAGGAIQLTTNDVGDVTAVTDGNGNTTGYQYDGIHRLTRITYPDVGAGQKHRQFGWLCCGLDTVTDENGRVTKHQYQQYTKRLWKLTEDYGGLNYTTEYTYDEVGNVKTVKNARAKTTTYIWDKADRLTRINYPDNTYETWTLRDDGRVRQHMDGMGRVTTYRYDASDRLAGSGAYKAIDYPSDTDVQIVRDKDGLITATVDASGAAGYEYYPSTWLKRTNVSAGTTKVVTYQYNGVGLVSSLTAPDGGSFSYSYDARNQLQSVTNPNGVTVSFAYDNGGRRIWAIRPGGWVFYDYNARNWITAVRNRTGAEGEVVRYDARYYYNDGGLWDHTGNPLKRVENFGGGDFTTTLRYDNVYRQTEETKRDSGGGTVYSVSYGYDQVGNRTSETRDGVSRTFVYDNNNKLTSASGGGESATFGYDSNGNMIMIAGDMYESRAMTYNEENRLVSVIFTLSGVTDTYSYNWQGLRTRATFDGVARRYVYHGDRVLEELNDVGGTLARYTTESGSYYEPMWHMQRWTGESRFPMYDGIGSVRGLVNQMGTVTDTYEMDAFGVAIGGAGATENPYRLGGAWGYLTDPSGMLQLGARHYWPDTGRFVQQDPIRDGMNWYAYAEGNPVAWVDPEGLFSVGGEAYGIVGGGFTIGWDPCTGPFVKGKVGVGIGAGVSIDAHELSPGRDLGIPGHGSAYGLGASGQVQVLVLGWAANASVGNAHDAAGQWRPYGPSFQPPKWRPTWNWPRVRRLKVGLSVSAGAEGALF